MEISNLYERVLLAQFAYEYIYQGAIALLGSIAVTAFIYDAIRGALGAGTTHLRLLAGRLILAMVMLALYPRIVRIACESSTEIARFMAEHGGWDDYWDSVTRGFESVENIQDENGNLVSQGFAKLTGLGKAVFLSVIVSWSYFLLRLVFLELQSFTALCATLLYVLGPIMIVLGIVTQNKSLWKWFQNMIQVTLWQAIPPLLILVVIGAQGSAIETGNVAHVISQNITLAILGLSTPIVVAYLFGQFELGALGMAGLAASTAFTSATGVSSWVGGGAVKQPIHIPHHHTSKRP